MELYLRPKYEFSKVEKKKYNKLFELIKKSPVENVIKFIDKNSDNECITLAINFLMKCVYGL